MVLCSILKFHSYSLPPTNLFKLLMILLVLSLLSIAWIMAAALSLSLFLQIDCGKYCIRIPLRRSSRAVRTSPFEVTFLKFVKLIIISSHRYPIQVLVVISLKNLEFSNSDDSSLRIHIASRLPVNSKTVELMAFTPPMRDSLEGMLVIAYWFLNPHCPRHQVFNPLDMPVICCLRLDDRSSILAA
uniref:Uncharacterized protein n=1 Tax=Tanacetum cinerariifolium TaxID=118510 RepID=A0A6L2KY86_TANCI|nr:hypothetical protein [Tanacetum cinerariifolium]